MRQAIIYSSPICAYCKKAKMFFEKHGIDVIEKDISKDKEALVEMRNKSNQMSVPVIEIDGHVIVGFDRHEVEELLGLE